MGNGVRTELRVPDLWYDLYARVLPGTSFVAAVYLTSTESPGIPNVVGFLILILAGLFCGLVTQPIASRTHDLIQELALVKGCTLKRGEKRQYIIDTSRSLGPETRPALVLGKMKAESVFFVQLAIFSALFMSLYEPMTGVRSTGQFWGLFWFAIVISLVFAWEFSSRRLRRAISEHNAAE